MQAIRAVFDFFMLNFPPARMILFLFPVSLLWSFAALGLAGYAKRYRNWKTGYSRKLFHFLIFFSAYFYQLHWGLPAVFILGWAVSLVLLFALLKGKGNMLYEALAREKDAPHRSRYIVYSYLSTFLGGVLSNLLFGHFAIFGYAVTGIADAVAEPVGTRLGKHRYKVFTFDKKPAERTLEGSMAVFVSGLAVAVFVMKRSGFPEVSFPVLLGISLLCTLVEALSPGGFDNGLLQLTASFLFRLAASN